MTWLQTIYIGCYLIPGEYELTQSYGDVITDNIHGLLLFHSRGTWIGTVIWWCDYRQYTWVVVISFQRYMNWHSHMMMWLQTIYMGCCYFIPEVYELTQSCDDVITDNIPKLLLFHFKGIRIDIFIWRCYYRQCAFLFISIERPTIGTFY